MSKLTAAFALSTLALTAAVTEYRVGFLGFGYIPQQHQSQLFCLRIHQEEEDMNLLSDFEEPIGTRRVVLL